MELALAAMVGLGLAAACGFRVFVPLLILSLCARVGWVQLGDEWTWASSTGALVTLGVATVAEIGAYYIPWLDNALDGLAAPAAVVAGTLSTAAVITDMDPVLQWSVALIGGGGLAGGVHAGSAALRLASSVTTGGLANPIVSSLEAVAATALSLLAIVLPIFAAVVLAAGAFVLWTRLRRKKTHENHASD